MKPKPITFQALISKISTLIDGGIRITLDLGSHDVETAKELMNYLQQPVGVAVAVE